MISIECWLRTIGYKSMVIEGKVLSQSSCDIVLQWSRASCCHTTS